MKNENQTLVELPVRKSKLIELDKFVYNPFVKSPPCSDSKHKIMRIEIDENLTRIDFVYVPPPEYQNGSWVEIDRNSFIRPVGTKHILSLVRAVGIPYAPRKHYFKSNKETLYYTLYFPALTKDVKEIDIIEKEIHDGTLFNFYGVSVQKIKQEVLRVRES